MTRFLTSSRGDLVWIKCVSSSDLVGESATLSRRMLSPRSQRSALCLNPAEQW